MVQAGLKAIYLSGWQVAADANLAGQTYPDQSLYPSNSVPALARRINQALQRADQIQHAEGRGEVDWLAPIVADGEAGVGGPAHGGGVTKGKIEAGGGGGSTSEHHFSPEEKGHHGVGEPARRGGAELFSEGAGGDGIQFPVHHTRGFPHHELLHLRTRSSVQGGRHVCLRASPERRVREGEGGIQGGKASILRRRPLL